MEDYFSQLSPSDQQKVREHFLQQTNTKQASKQTSNMKVTVTKGKHFEKVCKQAVGFLNEYVREDFNKSVETMKKRRDI